MDIITAGAEVVATIMGGGTADIVGGTIEFKRGGRGAMLARPYATLVLAATVANAAESYDVTNCGASTVTTISATAELTVMSVDTKGITRSNSANKTFDNATYQCASVVSITGAQQNGLGYCKFMVPDGDFVVGEQVLDSTGGGKWKFLQGTGRWKGITGGGEFMPLTSGKPIVAGTGQACVRATGTYELSK
jgi:hypothetical protein